MANNEKEHGNSKQDLDSTNKKDSQTAYYVPAKTLSSPVGAARMIQKKQVPSRLTVSLNEKLYLPRGTHLIIGSGEYSNIGQGSYGSVYKIQPYKHGLFNEQYRHDINSYVNEVSAKDGKTTLRLCKNIHYNNLPIAFALKSFLSETAQYSFLNEIKIYDCLDLFNHLLVDKSYAIALPIKGYLASSLCMTLRSGANLEQISTWTSFGLLVELFEQNLSGLITNGFPKMMILRDQQQTLFAIVATVFVQLQVLHSKGYVHADVKTSNIVLNLHPLRVSIIDFGLATKANSSIVDKCIRGSLCFTTTDRITGYYTFRDDYWSVLTSLLDDFAGTASPFETMNRAKKNNFISKKAWIEAKVQMGLSIGDHGIDDDFTRPETKWSQLLEKFSIREQTKKYLLQSVYPLAIEVFKLKKSEQFPHQMLLIQIENSLLHMPEGTPQHTLLTASAHWLRECTGVNKKHFEQFSKSEGNRSTISHRSQHQLEKAFAHAWECSDLLLNEDLRKELQETNLNDLENKVSEIWSLCRIHQCIIISEKIFLLLFGHGIICNTSLSDLLAYAKADTFSESISSMDMNALHSFLQCESTTEHLLVTGSARCFDFTTSSFTREQALNFLKLTKHHVPVTLKRPCLEEIIRGVKEAAYATTAPNVSKKFIKAGFSYTQKCYFFALQTLLSISKNVAYIVAKNSCFTNSINLTDLSKCDESFRLFMKAPIFQNFGDLVQTPITTLNASLILKSVPVNNPSVPANDTVSVFSPISLINILLPDSYLEEPVLQRLIDQTQNILVDFTDLIFVGPETWADMKESLKSGSALDFHSIFSMYNTVIGCIKVGADNHFAVFIFHRENNSGFFMFGESLNDPETYRFPEYLSKALRSNVVRGIQFFDDAFNDNGIIREESRLKFSNQRTHNYCAISAYQGGVKLVCWRLQHFNQKGAIPNTSMYPISICPMNNSLLRFETLNLLVGSIVDENKSLGNPVQWNKCPEKVPILFQLDPSLPADYNNTAYAKDTDCTNRSKNAFKSGFVSSTPSDNDLLSKAESTVLQYLRSHYLGRSITERHYAHAHYLGYKIVPSLNAFYSCGVGSNQLVDFFVDTYLSKRSVPQWAILSSTSTEKLCKETVNEKMSIPELSGKPDTKIYIGLLACITDDNGNYVAACICRRFSKILLHISQPKLREHMEDSTSVLHQKMNNFLLNLQVHFSEWTICSKTVSENRTINVAVVQWFREPKNKNLSCLIALSLLDLLADMKSLSILESIFNGRDCRDFLKLCDKFSKTYALDDKNELEIRLYWLRNGFIRFQTDPQLIPLFKTYIDYPDKHKNKPIVAEDSPASSFEICFILKPHNFNSLSNPEPTERSFVGTSGTCLVNETQTFHNPFFNECMKNSKRNVLENQRLQQFLSKTIIEAERSYLLYHDEMAFGTGICSNSLIESQSLGTELLDKTSLTPLLLPTSVDDRNGISDSVQRDHIGHIDHIGSFQSGILKSNLGYAEDESCSSETTYDDDDESYQVDDSTCSDTEDELSGDDNDCERSEEESTYSASKDFSNKLSANMDYQQDPQSIVGTLNKVSIHEFNRVTKQAQVAVTGIADIEPIHDIDQQLKLHLDIDSATIIFRNLARCDLPIKENVNVKMKHPKEIMPYKEEIREPAFHQKLRNENSVIAAQFEVGEININEIQCKMVLGVLASERQTHTTEIHKNVQDSMTQIEAEQQFFDPRRVVQRIKPFGLLTNYFKNLCKAYNSLLEDSFLALCIINVKEKTRPVLETKIDDFETVFQEIHANLFRPIFKEPFFSLLQNVKNDSNPKGVHISIDFGLKMRMPSNGQNEYSLLFFRKGIENQLEYLCPNTRSPSWNAKYFGTNGFIPNQLATFEAKATNSFIKLLNKIIGVSFVHNLKYYIPDTNLIFSRILFNKSDGYPNVLQKIVSLILLPTSSNIKDCKTTLATGTKLLTSIRDELNSCQGDARIEIGSNSYLDAARMFTKLLKLPTKTEALLGIVSKPDLISYMKNCVDILIIAIEEGAKKMIAGIETPELNSSLTQAGEDFELQNTTSGTSRIDQLIRQRFSPSDIDDVYSLQVYNHMMLHCLAKGAYNEHPIMDFLFNPFDDAYGTDYLFIPNKKEILVVTESFCKIKGENLHKFKLKYCTAAFNYAMRTPSAPERREAARNKSRLSIIFDLKRLFNVGDWSGALTLIIKFMQGEIWWHLATNKSIKALTKHEKKQISNNLFPFTKQTYFDFESSGSQQGKRASWYDEEINGFKATKAIEGLFQERHTSEFYFPILFANFKEKFLQTSKQTHVKLLEVLQGAVNSENLHELSFPMPPLTASDSKKVFQKELAFYTFRIVLLIDLQSARTNSNIIGFMTTGESKSSESINTLCNSMISRLENRLDSEHMATWALLSKTKESASFKTVWTLAMGLKLRDFLLTNFRKDIFLKGGFSIPGAKLWLLEDFVKCVEKDGHSENALIVRGILVEKIRCYLRAPQNLKSLQSEMEKSAQSVSPRLPLKRHASKPFFDGSEDDDDDNDSDDDDDDDDDNDDEDDEDEDKGDKTDLKDGVGDGITRKRDCVINDQHDNVIADQVYDKSLQNDGWGDDGGQPPPTNTGQANNLNSSKSLDSNPLHEASVQNSNHPLSTSEALVSDELSRQAPSVDIRPADCDTEFELTESKFSGSVNRVVLIPAKFPLVTSVPSNHIFNQHDCASGLGIPVQASPTKRKNFRQLGAHTSENHDNGKSDDFRFQRVRFGEQSSEASSIVHDLKQKHYIDLGQLPTALPQASTSIFVLPNSTKQAPQTLCLPDQSSLQESQVRSESTSASNSNMNAGFVAASQDPNKITASYFLPTEVSDKTKTSSNVSQERVKDHLELNYRIRMRELEIQREVTLAGIHERVQIDNNKTSIEINRMQTAVQMSTLEFKREELQLLRTGKSQLPSNSPQTLQQDSLQEANSISSFYQFVCQETLRKISSQATEAKDEISKARFDQQKKDVLSYFDFVSDGDNK